MSEKSKIERQAIMPREKPILMCAEMVRQTLAGNKAHTRRIINPQPPCNCEYVVNGASTHALCYAIGNPGVLVPPTPTSKDHRLRCPYGTIADKLWVRETFSLWCHSFESVGIEYAAGGDDKIVDFPDKKGMPSLETICQTNIAGGRRKRPSIFMPRWASRITLQIESVRVERLQEISVEDIKAEGITLPVAETTLGPRRVERITGKFVPCDYLPVKAIEATNDQWYVAHYAALWESLNGKGSWAKNPWVWVVTFKRVTG